MPFKHSVKKTGQKNASQRSSRKKRNKKYVAPKADIDTNASLEAAGNKIDNKKKKKKRGVLLTLFLILNMILCLLVAVFSFLSPESYLQDVPEKVASTLTISGILAIAQFFAAIGIWFWMRSALYAIYIIAACSFVLNLYVGIPVKDLLSGLVTVGIIYLLTRNKMEYFS